MIEPRTLKGFRDYLPRAMQWREQLMETARRVFRSFGFYPIDTPVLEYKEILTGKGSDETDRLMYAFQDHGGRDVGMRFDLTVPLARFVAQHQHELAFPFKRYHMAKVWRGENTHRGRYREFVQCDFDTVGTLATTADIETVLVIHDLMRAIGIDRFAIRLNNRKVLNGVLEQLELADRSLPVLRALDKLAKIGREGVAEELVREAGTSPDQTERILRLADLKGEPKAILGELESLVGRSERGRAGVDELRQVLDGASAGGIPPQQLVLDVSIARGLDYYTGTVVECFLDQLPQIGSICSGGRYDDLASAYCRQQLPGIGASLGLDRLLAALEELGAAPEETSPAPVLLTYLEADRLNDYLSLAHRIRRSGIGVEFYPEPKRLKQQLKYADRQGFPVVVIVGGDEFERGVCQIKHLRTGQTREVSIADAQGELTRTLEQMLRGPKPAEDEPPGWAIG